MIVKVFMVNGDPIVFANADNATISPTGYLTISSNGTKANPILTQIGGVASNMWTYYDILEDATVVSDVPPVPDPTDTTTGDGEITPS